MKSVEERERKDRIRKRVLEQVPVDSEIDENRLIQIIDQNIGRDRGKEYLRYADKKRLRTEIFNSMRKMDVLQELLEDEEITEIMVNGPEHIFIEKAGRLLETELEFDSLERLSDIAQQIASAGNRIVNETNPIFDPLYLKLRGILYRNYPLILWNIIRQDIEKCSLTRSSAP